MNRNVKILSRRLYSPSLKNIGWIEDAQLIFLIFHTFACNCFFSAAPSTQPRSQGLFPGLGKVREKALGTRLPSTLPDLQTNVWKVRKINRAHFSHATYIIQT